MNRSVVLIMTAAVSATAGVVLLIFLERFLRPLSLAAGPSVDTRMRFAEGERDRMLGIAKGMAASASGFLLALLSAVIEGKAAKGLPAWVLVAVLLGAVGFLLLAAAESQASARYMASAIGMNQDPTSEEEVLEW